MIIVGRSSSSANSFDTKVFKILQDLYKKQKFDFYSDYIYEPIDFFEFKTPLVPRDKLYVPRVDMLFWVIDSVFTLLGYREEKTRLNLKLIKVNKQFSCVGIDFFECLKKIDMRHIVRNCLSKMVYTEVGAISRKLELNEFKDKVSQEGMDNYICKETVIKSYGSYTIQTLYEFCTFLNEKSAFTSNEIEEEYLPKNTQIEKEMINAFLDEKIYPVFHATKLIAGKSFKLKGFIPCFMINNETQEMYADKHINSYKGERLLNYLSTGKGIFSKESIVSETRFLLSRAKGITFEPETYTGKTFIFGVE